MALALPFASTPPPFYYNYVPHMELSPPCQYVAYFILSSNEVAKGHEFASFVYFSIKNLLCVCSYTVSRAKCLVINDQQWQWP